MARRDDPAFLRGPTAEPGCGDFCFVWEGGIDALLATLGRRGRRGHRRSRAPHRRAGRGHRAGGQRLHPRPRSEPARVHLVRPRRRCPLRPCGRLTPPSHQLRGAPCPPHSSPARAAASASPAPSSSPERASTSRSPHAPSRPARPASTRRRSPGPTPRRSRGRSRRPPRWSRPRDARPCSSRPTSPTPRRSAPRPPRCSTGGARVDVVVHNGRYIGPGHMDRLLDTPIELIEKQLFANAVAQLILNQYFIPADDLARVAARSSTSPRPPATATRRLPPAKAAGVSATRCRRRPRTASRASSQVEHGHQGIRAYNVQPGFINTERMAQDMGAFGFELIGAPPDVIGAVIAWIATSPDATALAGQTVEAQFLCHERGLLPDWPGPRPNTSELALRQVGRRARAARGAAPRHLAGLTPRVCTACEAARVGDARFCTACGTPYVDATDDTPRPTAAVATSARPPTGAGPARAVPATSTVAPTGRTARAAEPGRPPRQGREPAPGPPRRLLRRGRAPKAGIPTPSAGARAGGGTVGRGARTSPTPRCTGTRCRSPRSVNPGSRGSASP